MRVLARKDNKKPTEEWPLTILYDDREKKGRWTIDHFKFKFVKKRLKVADYTIKGFEHIIAVEKKSGFKELIGNLTGKKRIKFMAYLKKLSKFPLPILVIEGNFNSLPRIFRELKYSGMNIEGVYSWVTKIMVEYGIHVVCMDCSQKDKDMFLYHLFSTLHEEARRIKDEA